MKQRDFKAALGAADRVLQSRAIPPAVESRLQQRLMGRPAVRPWRARHFWALAVATCVAAVVIVLVRTYEPDPNGATLGSRVEWLEIEHASADLVTHTDTHQQKLVVERGSCLLIDRRLGLAMETVGPIEVSREPGAMRIVRGQIAVRVQPRKGLPPVRLLVSHGSIEVVGTYFTVNQSEQHGRVSLHEGKVRFRSSGGTTVELTPGQSLDWPLAAGSSQQYADSGLVVPEDTELQHEDSVASAAALDAGPHARAPAAAASAISPRTSRSPLVERLEQIQGLRSRGQWARAADELAGLLREPLPATTRERVSYELGSIVTYQIRDSARACTVWRAYQKAYPQGRYRTEVERAQRSLNCGEGK